MVGIAFLVIWFFYILFIDLIGSRYNKEIYNIKPEFGHFRAGDILHSQASIKKAEMILGYTPEFDAKKGFEKV